MPAEGRENPLLKKGIFDAFFREKYLTKNTRKKLHLDPVPRWGRPRMWKASRPHRLQELYLHQGYQ